MYLDYSSVSFAKFIYLLEAQGMKFMQLEWEWGEVPQPGLHPLPVWEPLGDIWELKPAP